MKTKKLISNQNPTYHSPKDKNSYIPVTFLKNTGNTGGKLRPQDKGSSRLQELSLMNKNYFGAFHYDIHIYMKLGYTISRIFPERSPSELETLHHLCELEQTQVLQLPALAVVKIPYAGYLMSEKNSNFIDYKENIIWYTCITILCF